MSEEDWIDETNDEWENGISCDYGVCEFCSNPQIKEMGLCTTDCLEYRKFIEEEMAETK
jgi:translation elongation factor EF-1alpha